MHENRTANAKLRPLATLIAVTMVWGIAFVQVKDALNAYPLIAFLALRFAIATATLAPVGTRRVRHLGVHGIVAGLLTGVLIAGGFILQTAGLERTTVSATGFITGAYVVLTPLASVVLFRARIGRAGWAGVAVTTVGLGTLAGVHGGPIAGDLLVLGGVSLFALQTALMERYAARFDTIGITFVQMVAAVATLTAAACATGSIPLPSTAGVVSALILTGMLSSALGILAQNWAQQRLNATQTALSLSLEPVWTAFFGVTLAGDQLGANALLGSTLIMAGLAVSEPSSATLFRRVSGAGRRRARDRAWWGAAFGRLAARDRVGNHPPMSFTPSDRRVLRGRGEVEVLVKRRYTVVPSGVRRRVGHLGRA